MTAKTALNLLKSDPWPWYWDYRVEVELFRVLSSLWEKTGEEERAELVRLTLEGPPRDRFRKDLGDDEWERLWDRMVWERLARLTQGTHPLPEEASSMLASIEEKHQRWRLEGEDREDFPVWSESGTGYDANVTAEALLAMPMSQRLQTLLDEGYYRDGNLSAWEWAVREDPDAGFGLIRYAASKAQLDVEVLTHTFRGLAEVATTASFIDPLNDVLDIIPPDAWGRAIHPLARTVERVVRTAELETHPLVLTLWDTAFFITLDKPSGVEDTDVVTWALNHPAGRLTEALLDLLRKTLGADIRAIPSPFRERMERPLNPAVDLIDHGGGRAARVMLCSRTSWLHWLDAEWTLNHLVPLFDWDQPREAMGAWRAFLWAPSLDPELWAVLRPHVGGAFEHRDFMGSRVARLVELLVLARVEGLPLSDEELREYLEAGSELAARAASHHLAELLKGAGDKAGELWKRKVDAILRQAWPRDQALRNAQVTEYLATAAVRSGEAFPEAVDAVTPLIEPQLDLYIPLREISASEHPERFPEATIQLLAALVSGDAAMGRTPLRNVLRRVEAGGMDLQESPGGRRLLDAAAR